MGAYTIVIKANLLLLILVWKNSRDEVKGVSKELPARLLKLTISQRPQPVTSQWTSASQSAALCVSQLSGPPAQNPAAIPGRALTKAPVSLHSGAKQVGAQTCSHQTRMVPNSGTIQGAMMSYPHPCNLSSVLPAAAHRPAVALPQPTAKQAQALGKTPGQNALTQPSIQMPPSQQQAHDAVSQANTGQAAQIQPVSYSQAPPVAQTPGHVSVQVQFPKPTTAQLGEFFEAVQRSSILSRPTSVPPGSTDFTIPGQQVHQGASVGPRRTLAALATASEQSPHLTGQPQDPQSQKQQHGAQLAAGGKENVSADCTGSHSAPYSDTGAVGCFSPPWLAESAAYRCSYTMSLLDSS